MPLAEINSEFRRGQLGGAETLIAPEAHDPSRTVSAADRADDLSRNVYCVLGMPIDAIHMATVLDRIEAAAAGRVPFLISTPNTNFLVNSRSDGEFRESLLDSDICPPDGMPIVWIARLFGVPIKMRISGSDIFEALKAPDRCLRRLTVLLFGGGPGVAAAAASTLNSVPTGLSCVGSIDPGFGAVDELSHDNIIDIVNSSRADFLIVSLGAKKGQVWLRRNHKRLTIPIRAHLGATISFQAGTVKRAPPGVRAWGLEWLWRIKEEPYLWRRYWNDGRVLLRLLLTRVLPLAMAAQWHRLSFERHGEKLRVTVAYDHESIRISFCGAAVERHVEKAIRALREALTVRDRTIVIDLSETRLIDARFFGLFLMLRKQLKEGGRTLQFVGTSGPIARIFRLNEVGFLLAPDQSA
jgi:N-acetylglucosaminyldiphosphoundecaprenol N-acetyl-beta-D-mannosaminyltransferase